MGLKGKIKECLGLMRVKIFGVTAGQSVYIGSVNKQADSLFSTLIVNPSAPYWYLYALFFIFLVTPTFSSVKVAVVRQ